MLIYLSHSSTVKNGVAIPVSLRRAWLEQLGLYPQGRSWRKEREKTGVHDYFCTDSQISLPSNLALWWWHGLVTATSRECRK